MRELTVAPQARRDLDEIWDWVSANSVRTADRLQKAILEKFLMLLRQPLLGEACDDISPGLRSFPVSRYVIYYRIVSHGIDVARVVDGARDVSLLFGELESNGNEPP